VGADAVALTNPQLAISLSTIKLVLCKEGKWTAFMRHVGAGLDALADHP